MGFPKLPEGYDEVGRGWAPADDAALPEWEPWETASVCVRRGVQRGNGSRFLRVDYDSTKAGWSAESPAWVELKATQLDPLTKAGRRVLAEGTFSLHAAPDACFTAEFTTAPQGAAGHPTETRHWVHALFSEPVAGRCAPVRLELRFRGEHGGQTDPPGSGDPYRLVLNTAQLRSRRNVRQHTAPMGNGQQVVSLFYTNPDAQGLGVMKRMNPPYSPPYHELSSDLRLFWEYQVPADGKVNLHRHQTEEIWYVTAGEGTFIQDGEEQVIRAGDSIIIYPGSWHGMRADRGDFTFLVIDVGVGRSNQPH